MRFIISVLFLLSIKMLEAQTTDSTAIKLEHYRQLYQSNLINSSEYQRLKGRLLHIPFDLHSDPDSLHAQKLYDHYRARITGGSIMLGIGGAMLISEIVWVRNVYAGALVPDAVILYGVVGGVSTATGCLFLALGLRDRALFRNQYLSLNVSGTDNQIGLACKF